MENFGKNLSAIEIEENRRCTRSYYKKFAQANVNRLLQKFNSTGTTENNLTLPSKVNLSQSLSFSSKLEELFSSMTNPEPQSGEHQIEGTENGPVNNNDQNNDAGPPVEPGNPIQIVTQPLSEPTVTKPSGEATPNVHQQLADMVVLLTSQNQMVLDCIGQVRSVEQRISANSQLAAQPQSTPTHRSMSNRQVQQGSFSAPPVNNNHPAVQHSGINVPYSANEIHRQEKIDLNRWNIKFDGSGKDMTVESFIFRIERMAEINHVTYRKLNDDFHCFLTSKAAKWYWQLLEDHKDEPLDYLDVKRAMLAEFRTAKSDFEIIKELVERKQLVGESFDDFYAEMHDMSFRLQAKIPERELANIIKDNLRGHLASLVFPIQINTLQELKQECKRAEKLAKEIRQKSRHVNEINMFVDLDEDDKPCSSNSAKNFQVEAIGSNNFKNQDGKFNNRQFNHNQKPNDLHTHVQNQTNNLQQLQALKPQLCLSPFHLNLCFTCGMPGDYYIKNSSIAPENKCKGTFHQMKCHLCGKIESYCVFESQNQNIHLNKQLAEVSGGQSQMQRAPVE